MISAPHRSRHFILTTAFCQLPWVYFHSCHAHDDTDMLFDNKIFLLDINMPISTFIRVIVIMLLTCLTLLPNTPRSLSRHSFFPRGSTVHAEPRPPHEGLGEVSKPCFSTVGRTPWTSDQPVARPLPTKDSTTQKDEDKYPWLKRDSTPLSTRSRPTP
jgi:hypothetical protein